VRRKTEPCSIFISPLLKSTGRQSVWLKKRFQHFWPRLTISHIGSGGLSFRRISRDRKTGLPVAGFRSFSFVQLPRHHRQQPGLTLRCSQTYFLTNANQCLFFTLVLCIFSCYNSRLLVNYTRESFSELALWPSLPLWCHFVTLGQVNVTSSLQGAGGLVHWKCTNIISAVTLRDDFDFGIAVALGFRVKDCPSDLQPDMTCWEVGLKRQN